MSAISINVEPYDPDTDMEDFTSPRNEKKSQEDKRSCIGSCGTKCSTIAWIVVACAILLLGAGLTAYFLIGPKPEPPTTSTISPTTIIVPSTSPTVQPITTTAATVTPSITTTIEPTTTKPEPTKCIPIRWLKDVPLPPANNHPRRASLFSGKVPHRTALEICSKMNDALFKGDMGNLIESMKVNLWKGALYFTSIGEEESFDNIIQANSVDSIDDSVFRNLPLEERMMWTGCYYQQNGTSWLPRCQQNPFNGYNNFCDQEGWLTELKQLQGVASTSDEIYIVKDYGKAKGCWRLYLLKALMASEFPFACIITKETSTSGQDAIKKANLDLCSYD